MKMSKDERQELIEKKSESIAFRVTLLLLCISTIIRGLFFNEAAWDLLAIAIIACFIATWYQYKKDFFVFSSSLDKKGFKLSLIVIPIISLIIVLLVYIL